MIRDLNNIASNCDASGIEGKTGKVEYPETIQDVQKIVKGNQKISIRGAGTGLAGGCVPQQEAVIDISKMNKILDFDKSGMTIEVEAGLVLDELNEFLEKYDLEFPVQPGSHSVCTIGGMIATNAAGERAVKYGKTEKWIESLEVVDGNGEILKIGKYNLHDFVGMEGITGIVCKARLKLIKKKERTALIIPFNDFTGLIDAVENFKELEHVSEIEFLDKFTSSLINLPERYHIIVEIEGGENPLENVKLLDGLEYEGLMKKRDSLYPSLASQGFVRIEDPKIPLNRFQELAILLEAFKVPYYGHLGVGIIHPVFRIEDKEKIKKMYNFVKKLKGEISGEHGIGILKKEFLEESQKKLLSIVRKRYDPFCKLNCGKVV